MGINAQEDGGMSSQSGAAAGNAEAALDAGKLQALVNETVNKALGPRLKRLQDDLLENVTASLAKLIPQKEEPKQPESNDAQGERLTVKALHQEIESLKKANEAEKRAAQEAKAREAQIAKRAALESHFAKHLGADSPDLRPYVEVYSSKFENVDGVLGQKVLGEYGEERFVPIGEAVEALFNPKAGELKHLVQRSKAAQMPPATWHRSANGQPIQAPPNMTVNPLLAEIARGISENRPEMAPHLAQMALVPSQDK